MVVFKFVRDALRGPETSRFAAAWAIVLLMSGMGAGFPNPDSGSSTGLVVPDAVGELWTPKASAPETEKTGELLIALQSETVDVVRQADISGRIDGDAPIRDPFVFAPPPKQRDPPLI